MWLAAAAGMIGQSPHLRVLNLHHAGKTPSAVEGDVFTGSGTMTWTVSGRYLPLTLGAHSLTTTLFPKRIQSVLLGRIVMFLRNLIFKKQK